MSWVRRAENYPYFDNDGLPIGFAHRGGALTGANVGLENSMVAFESAVDLGYRYLETDVHATSDGVLLAFHDRTLDRVTDRSGVVSRLRYDEVKRALIDGREPIPLLSEILERWPEVRINVDAKADNTVGPLVDVINRQRAWDRVCVASFSPSRLHRLRARLGPRVASSLATVGVGALRLLPGALPRRLALGRAGQAAQVPVRRGRLEIVTAEFVQRAHLLGKQVHVWTIDVPAEMGRLLDLGVDAVISDRTDLLRDVYRRRGIWTG